MWRVVARAAVAAGDGQGLSPRFAQFLERGGELGVEHDGVAAWALELPKVKVFRYLKFVEAH